MTKLLSIMMCIVFTLGIIVSSLSEINESIVKDGGLRDRAVSWIDQAIP
ncbi:MULTISPECIES: hypothetical protein [Brevibacillus]|jgi:hypothetical protein|uniref:Uncharacterized protein n=1 Tax=Brevibacillus centrosporus TaxID=54910 RepID=A0A1I4E6B3_9BACL|nr:MULTISPECIES: hypothetical protein [Brevibacillus]MEC2133116.1 hypothetical protein [Brevibacillus centrosporus]MED1795709.1 hypothetical protein [Brevibacillus nitrificans]MED4912003.1 hypothetical protein [Brevibacillus centrosporus]SFL01305.1 hypothetical protein SAMN05518846_12932 [Brevibacillus centrosporus]